jgi:hypothetical protein
VFGRFPGSDKITDFQATGAEHDVIRFDATLPYNDFNSLMQHAQQVGTGANVKTVVHIDDANSLTLTGVTLASLTASDFLFHV